MIPPCLHHVAVRTVDLVNSVAWYRDFLGAKPTWSTDTFSELTRSRLPGIVRLTEVAIGDLRFHLFECAGTNGTPDPDTVQFQHLCMAVESTSELYDWRERWIGLYHSGRYVFARPEEPTAVVVDKDGTQSFYCHDVNGLELEFVYVPGEPH